MTQMPISVYDQCQCKMLSFRCTNHSLTSAWGGIYIIIGKHYLTGKKHHSTSIADSLSRRGYLIKCTEENTAIIGCRHFKLHCWINPTQGDIHNSAVHLLVKIQVIISYALSSKITLILNVIIEFLTSVKQFLQNTANAKTFRTNYSRVKCSISTIYTCSRFKMQCKNTLGVYKQYTGLNNQIYNRTQNSPFRLSKKFTQSNSNVIVYKCSTFHTKLWPSADHELQEVWPYSKLLIKLLGTPFQFWFSRK